MDKLKIIGQLAYLPNVRDLKTPINRFGLSTRLFNMPSLKTRVNLCLHCPARTRAAVDWCHLCSWFLELRKVAKGDWQLSGQRLHSVLDGNGVNVSRSDRGKVDDDVQIPHHLIACMTK